MLPAIFNHLWQSTAFAAMAGLLTLALRKNHARVRHGVWLAASIRFLIPISLLIALGGAIPWQRTQYPMPSGFTAAMDEVSEPFTSPRTLPISASPAPGPLPAILLAVWKCGFLGLAVAWLIRWLRILAIMRAATPVAMEIPIRVRSSKASLEPGVFGVFRYCCCRKASSSG